MSGLGVVGGAGVDQTVINTLGVAVDEGGIARDT